MNQNLHRLISAACDNRATEAELTQLAQLLRDDSLNRDEYLRYVDLHAALADEALPATAFDLVDYRSAVATHGSRRRTARALMGNRSRKTLLLVAAALVIAVVGVFQWNSIGRDLAALPGPIAVASEPSLATMLFSEDCRWPGQEISEGQRLNPGRIDLESGTAVLRFDGGAELILVGPAAIDLQTPGRVLVHRGDIVVRATDGAEGFVVTTPTSRVVDLGTEFAVKVDSTGETEVHVLEGEVSYRGLHVADELSRILRAGEGVAIDENGHPRSVPMNSLRFQDFVNQINPRSRVDLLTVYEGFNYSPGRLPLSHSTVGRGWAGPWRHLLSTGTSRAGDDATAGELTIVHREIQVPWPVPGGRLGMLKLPDGASTYIREMTRPIDLDARTATFFSVMIAAEPIAATGLDGTKPPATRNAERLSLTIASSDDPADTSIAFGYTKNFIPFIQLANGSKFDSPLTMPPTRTSLWIGKIVSRPGGDDEVSLRVYGESDSLDYAEPATWHVDSRNVRLSGTLDRIVLHSEGPNAKIIDELRLGPTWRSVAPISVETALENQE